VLGQFLRRPPVLRAFLVTVMCCAADPVLPLAGPSAARVSMAIARPPSPFQQAIAHAKIDAPLARQSAQIKVQRDSIWNGLLIGAGAGAVGGYVWARHLCGTNDSECFTISATAGVLGGVAIGAAVGAILDALS
jgi:hypothetical protein